MTLDLTATRAEVVDLLETLDFKVQTTAGADFTRHGEIPKGSDIEISIGTVYGEVSVSAKSKAAKYATVRRITGEAQIGSALLEIHDWVRIANARGKTEGWL